MISSLLMGGVNQSITFEAELWTLHLHQYPQAVFGASPFFELSKHLPSELSYSPQHCSGRHYEPLWLSEMYLGSKPVRISVERFKLTGRFFKILGAKYQTRQSC
jgi:hypothetical protein